MMITSLVRAMLAQRLVIVVLTLILMGFGLHAAQRLSVDAFPDVTNIQVQIATEAVGRSPEEIERLVTVPLEIAMTGLPGLEEMRSLNKSGLSIITLVLPMKPMFILPGNWSWSGCWKQPVKCHRELSRAWVRFLRAWERFINTRSIIPMMVSGH